jgi:hypothetical protein
MGDEIEIIRAGTQYGIKEKFWIILLGPNFFGGSRFSLFQPLEYLYAPNWTNTH